MTEFEEKLLIKLEHIIDSLDSINESIEILGWDRDGLLSEDPSGLELLTKALNHYDNNN